MLVYNILTVQYMLNFLDNLHHFQMIVSCGLNVGKLLKVLNEGLLKEETHLAPLMCLAGNEVRKCFNRLFVINHE